MRQIRNLVFSLTVLFVGWACTTEYSRPASLQQTLETIDADPAQALQMLENVPATDLLDKDGQMQYVVLLTQAKYMNRQDITDHSQILEAQRYFADKDPEMATRASFYAACYSREKQQDDQALEYYLLANYYAEQADNLLFRAKSTHWIGSLYYNKEVLDSAHVYYQQALELYNLISNTESYQMDLLNLIGKIYLRQQEFDEALNYFLRGGKIANNLEDKKFKGFFEYGIGIVYRERGDYETAKKYFNQALLMDPDQEDSLRIYLSYARLYKAMEQPDSMIHYLNLVKNRMPEITYPYTRRAIYKELSYYYANEGNMIEMRRYDKLADAEDNQIRAKQADDQMALANQRFQVYKQKANQKYTWALKIGIGTTIVLFFLLVIFWADKQFFKRKFKEAYQEKQFHLMDFQRFLLVGMRQFAKSREAILEDPAQPVDKTQAEKELLQVQMNFNVELARQAKEMISQRMPPEAQALLDTFSTDDWCNIQLSRYYCEKEVTRLMGYEPKFEFYIIRRKQELRKLLEEAGLDQEAIRYFFMQEPVKTN